jgi:hypothetical protein
VSVDPRADAQRVAGDAYDVRVLEPSRPAVVVEPFADDPTARGAVVDGRRLLSPVTNGDETWDAWAGVHPERASWCAERWLGAWTRLQPIDDRAAFGATLDSWHALGEHVLAGARHRANGKIGLRWTRGGIGTPFFGHDEQVRVDGPELVHVTGDREVRASVSTLADAADFFGTPPGVPGALFEPGTDGSPSRRLPVDATAAARLADWFGFATAVLAQWRTDAADASPSLVQLWPEHFDIACDVGHTAAGTRANYGASPGDAQHPEPYLYVGPWDLDRVDRGDPYWDEPFGASLPYGALLDAADQRAAAAGFFRAGAARLRREPR